MSNELGLELDAFYTPDLMARQALGLVRKPPAVVADFSAGAGALLKAARDKWSLVEVIGTDISPNSIRKMRTALPDAVLGVCDFLNANSRRRCRALNSAINRVDVALLNPPFSCRGASRTAVTLNGYPVTCSSGLAFLINAFQYMRADGEIIAILPAGSMSAERDKDAWRLIKSHASVNIVGWNDRNAFKDCFPTTAMVHLRLSLSPRDVIGSETRVSAWPDNGKPRVLLYRGKRPMFKVPRRVRGKATPFVHSTELRRNTADLSKRKIAEGVESILGPAVLLPRVGLPSFSKVAIIEEAEVALSDCVFAICCLSLPAAQELMARIRANWDNLRLCYSGTGAPYVTAARLAEWIRLEGYQVFPHPSASKQLSNAMGFSDAVQTK